MKTLLNIVVLLFLISCNSQNIQKELYNNINSIVITIYPSKENLSPLILFIEFHSKKVIIMNTKIKTVPIPTPPDSLSMKKYNNEEERIIFELIKFPDSDLNILQTKLNEFEEKDYEDKTAFVNDGMGVVINMVYNRNRVKNVTLINDSTDNHKELMRKISKLIQKHSQNAEFLKKYFE